MHTLLVVEDECNFNIYCPKCNHKLISSEYDNFDDTFTLEGCVLNCSYTDSDNNPKGCGEMILCMDPNSSRIFDKDTTQDNDCAEKLSIAEAKIYAKEKGFKLKTCAGERFWKVGMVELTHTVIDKELNIPGILAHNDLYELASKINPEYIYRDILKQAEIHIKGLVDNHLLKNTLKKILKLLPMHQVCPPVIQFNDTQNKTDRADTLIYRGCCTECNRKQESVLWTG